MKIEIKNRKIKAPKEDVYDFLMDMSNYKQLLPPDKVENWSCSKDICSFQVRSMGHLGLKRVASTPYSLIYLDSHGKTPFKFTLNFYLSERDKATETNVVFEGDVNPFMKMMLEKPLTDFLYKLVDRLVNVFTPQA